MYIGNYLLCWLCSMHAPWGKILPSCSVRSKLPPAFLFSNQCAKRHWGDWQAKEEQCPASFNSFCVNWSMKIFLLQLAMDALFRWLHLCSWLVKQILVFSGLGTNWWTHGYLLFEFRTNWWAIGIVCFIKITFYVIKIIIALIYAQ